MLTRTCTTQSLAVNAQSKKRDAGRKQMQRSNLPAGRLARLWSVLETSEGTMVDVHLEPHEGEQDGFEPWLYVEAGPHEFLVTIDEEGAIDVRDPEGRDALAAWKGVYGDLQA